MDVLKAINDGPVSGDANVDAWIATAVSVLLGRIEREAAEQAGARYGKKYLLKRFNRADYTPSEWGAISRALSATSSLIPVSPLALLRAHSRRATDEAAKRRAIARELGIPFPKGPKSRKAGSASRTVQALEADFIKNWNRSVRRCNMPSSRVGERVCNRFFWSPRRGRGAECPECQARGSRTGRYYQRQQLDAVAVKYRRAKDRLKHRVGLSDRARAAALRAYAEVMERHRKRPRAASRISADFAAVTPPAGKRGRPKNDR